MEWASTILPHGEISFPLKKTERLQVLSGLPGAPLSASAGNASALGSAYSCATDLSSAVR